MSRKEKKSEISRKWLGGSPIFALKKNKGNVLVKLFVRFSIQVLL